MEPMTLAVTAVEEPGFSVHLEPEGMTYEVAPQQRTRAALPGVCLGAAS
jgi:hypothetical protein